MGQQQSSEKQPAPRGVTPHGEGERKVRRRTSVPALSSSRSQPADPSASNASAVAQVASPHNVEKQQLKHILHSSSPDDPVRTNTRVGRSNSRSAGEKKDNGRAIAIRQTKPLSVPATKEALPSESIDIPRSATTPRALEESEADYRAYQERHYAPVSALRPPRLPIPIADAQSSDAHATPDSPELRPLDTGTADVPVFVTDEPPSAIQPSVRRRGSFTSDATQEEDEIGDELQPYGAEQSTDTVPTTIEWNYSGDRVFVTGTFATWDRKYRLHPRKDGRPGMTCTINLPPGTHHLKFWVDSEMKVAKDIATAVDFNNVLVNYIEVDARDVQSQRRESVQPQQTRQGFPIGSEPVSQEAAEQPVSAGITPGEEIEGVDDVKMEELPPGDFRSIMPQYLADIDLPDDDPRYQQAVSLIQEANNPPTLPMFLNRSILNGNLLVKDDSSVLTLPNHTVLNHLMTSSVKNGVLATSVTTRYKKKYVTTISFKPVPNVVRAH